VQVITSPARVQPELVGSTVARPVRAVASTVMVTSVTVVLSESGAPTASITYPPSEPTA
jgi:hypothetical protein